MRGMDPRMMRQELPPLPISMVPQRGGGREDRTRGYGRPDPRMDDRMLVRYPDPRSFYLQNPEYGRPLPLPPRGIDRARGDPRPPLPHNSSRSRDEARVSSRSSRDSRAQPSRNSRSEKSSSVKSSNETREKSPRDRAKEIARVDRFAAGGSHRRARTDDHPRETRETRSEEDSPKKRSKVSEEVSDEVEELEVHKGNRRNDDDDIQEAEYENRYESSRQENESDHYDDRSREERSPGRRHEEDGEL